MVSYFDKNTRERIPAIEKKVAAGKMSAEEGERRIARLKAKPDYWIRGPKDTRVHVRPSHSEAAAKKAAARLDADLDSGAHIPANLLKTQYHSMLADYITKKKGKDASAVTYAEAGQDMIGTLRLGETHENIKLLVDHILIDLPARWPVTKTRWNYLATVQSAVQQYLDAHQKLNIKNPVKTAKKIAEVRRGTRKRKERPTMEEYRDHVRRAGKAPFPKWFQLLVVANAESAFRGKMMVSGFRWEKMDLTLDLEKGVYPYITITVSKQKGEAKGEEKEFPISYDLYKALRAYMAADPRPHEVGQVFPVKNIPRKWWSLLFRETGTTRLVPHDYRRLWKLRYLEHNPKLTAAGIGQETLSMDIDYTILERRELEALYRGSYAEAEV